MTEAREWPRSQLTSNTVDLQPRKDCPSGVSPRSPHLPGRNPWVKRGQHPGLFGSLETSRSLRTLGLKTWGGEGSVLIGRPCGVSGHSKLRFVIILGGRGAGRGEWSLLENKQKQVAFCKVGGERGVFGARAGQAGKSHYRGRDVCGLPAWAGRWEQCCVTLWGRWALVLKQLPLLVVMSYSSHRRLTHGREMGMVSALHRCGGGDGGAD